jgi:hypothetical protein
MGRFPGSNEFITIGCQFHRSFTSEAARSLETYHTTGRRPFEFKVVSSRQEGQFGQYEINWIRG